MKSITEFWNVHLQKGLASRAALTAEGKTAEEIQTSLGETFKFEGDKLKHFVNALEVASQNLEKLARVLVVSLNEGENAPPKAVKVEEFYYLPEFQVPPRAVVTTKSDARGGAKKSNQKSGPKESPWGLSPEQKAAKKGAGAAKAAKPS